jgi:four helix bundle protein
MYQDLNAWQKAYQLGLSVYKLTSKFPKEELYGMTSQLRRSAVSISANIAEGSSRQSQKEFKQFISMARGSLAEVETWLLFSKDLNYITETEFQDISKLASTVGNLLFGLYKSLK